MTNQLTQAELIDLAKEAGFKETVWSNILGVNVESLPKFAQLIQQRQVAQALEKAVEVCSNASLHRATDDWRDACDLCQNNILALIGQPVDHIEESLGMVEQGGHEAGRG